MCDVFKVEGTKADGRVFVELPNGDEVNLFQWVGLEGVDTVTMYQLVGSAPAYDPNKGLSFTGFQVRP